MLSRRLLIAVGTLALGCNSTLDLGMDDAGGIADARDAKGSDSSTDGGSSPSTLVFTYCSYTSDAGTPACYGLAPWDASAAESAQAQLNCMNAKGSVVSACASARLAGCCSTQICPPPPPGQDEACDFTAQQQPGVNVSCNYDEDAGTAHVQDLKCVAGGGTWTTTLPQ